MGTGNENKWYRLDRILRYDVAYRIIIGERSNGKTYSIKERIIDRIKRENIKFVYMRRLEEQVTRKLMKRLFSDIDEYAIKELGDFIKFSTDDGFYIEDEDGEKTIVGYAMCVEKGTKQKGIAWNDIKLILFDEFLEYGSQIEDEISKFQNVISTIVRKRDDVEIFMCANTVTKFSPYFTLFGIDIKKLRKGEIHYLKHSKGVTCAIEYTKSSNIINGVKQTNKYVGFDNDATSDMILYGEWEYDVVNVKDIDGIGWSCKRYLFPVYITAIGEVYEISIYEGDNPILFIRKINTQNGMVRKEIEYNLSYDNSVILANKNGVVPMYGKISEYMGENVNGYWKLINECIKCKRVVYDKIESGSDFMKIYKYI